MKIQNADLRLIAPEPICRGQIGSIGRSDPQNADPRQIADLRKYLSRSEADMYFQSDQKCR
jgi:hypothetical protein